MTSQTKQYIELTDVLAAHLQCKACKAALSVPIESRRLPETCPNCNEQWANARSERKVAETFQTFVAAYQSLRHMLHGENPASVGFTLALEIRPESKGEKSN
jgi:protein-arginine kinase activator protein McsA